MKVLIACTAPTMDLEPLRTSLIEAGHDLLNDKAPTLGDSLFQEFLDRVFVYFQEACGGAADVVIHPGGSNKQGEYLTALAHASGTPVTKKLWSTLHGKKKIFLAFWTQVLQTKPVLLSSGMPCTELTRTYSACTKLFLKVWKHVFTAVQAIFRKGSR